MNKQVKVILAVVLLIAAAGLIAYNLFFSGSSGPDPTKVFAPENRDPSAPPPKAGGARVAPGANPG